jgi:nicotinamidase-related amidase
MRTIAAQPFDFAFDPAHTALIVIDMQRDFIEPGGFGATLGNDVSRLKRIVPAVRRLIDVFRAVALPVIHTRECHKPDLSDLPRAKHARGKPSLRIGDPGPMGRILIAGEPGADIVPELAAAPGESVIDKPGKGAFYATPLADIPGRKGDYPSHPLRRHHRGLRADTMREANDRGFECLLVEDATESYFPEFKQAALDMLRAQGAIVGWTATVDQVAAALRHRSGARL